MGRVRGRAAQVGGCVLYAIDCDSLLQAPRLLGWTHLAAAARGGWVFFCLRRSGCGNASFVAVPPTAVPPIMCAQLKCLVPLGNCS